MNTTRLQGFAAEARVALMKAVRARLDAAMEPDSAASVDNPCAFRNLQDEIRDNGGGEQGRARTAERHAYRWFNQIIALRYMDANDFTGLHVVSGQDANDANALPEVLSAAKRGEFDEDVFDSAIGAKARLVPTIIALLDGSRSSNDPQGEAYGLLLRAYCDYWHRFLPFMFDEAGAADELLMPADLLASDSVLRRAVEVMTVDDCVSDGGRGNVEIIGWLYQFYIAERKSEVMDGFKKSKKAGAAEIPAATQLFTPDWIVRYLVQNTVGRLWVRNHPESRLWEHWEYYIAPGADDAGESLRIDSPEELTVCDPACGSGHMLTYAFDLLYDIYDEAGYSANEIPGLILEHNLYGMEIDERAANLASFALTMKARGRYRRFFRKGRQVQPNIRWIESERFSDEEIAKLNERYYSVLSEEDWNTYEFANTFGSLIQPSPDLASLAALTDIEDAEAEEDDNNGELAIMDSLFVRPDYAERARKMLVQTRYLTRKYAVVIANPPYMCSGNMGGLLKDYVQDCYKDGKADLFAAFMLRNLRLIQPNALLGMITMQSWMFLSSFESLRKNLLAQHSIETMAHLGAGAFDSIGGEVVSTTAFTIRNGRSHGRGTYLRLVDVQGDANQAAACSRLLDMSRESAVSGNGAADTKPRMFTVDQHDFAQIPGSPIVYWLSDAMRKTFTMGKPLEEVAKPRHGMATGNNEAMIRYWHEISRRRFDRKRQDADSQLESDCAWFPYNKGGSYRKWYGNQDYVLRYDEYGRTLMKIFPGFRPDNRLLFFRPAISWSKISSGDPSFRYFPSGFAFADAGLSVIADNSTEKKVLAYVNSSVAYMVLTAIAPTLNFEVGQISALPIADELARLDYENIEELIRTSRSDWNSYETSWDFANLEVLGADYFSTAADGVSFVEGNREVLLAERIPAYIAHCKNIAEEQRQREIRNNEMVADAYGVRAEVPCDVPIERVSLKRNPAFAYPKAAEAERDANMTVDVVKEIISYAVGCMFGRYSLDKPGLVLASQGETVEDYLAQVPRPSFMPDEDNVIPITDEEWFEDDIVSRFRDFLAVTCGERHLNENIAYMEQVLGKPLRKYFAIDFYDDHVRMYKNRPIYWMYSSTPNKKGAFKALVYLHRYTPATTNMVLKYLREFTAKLNAQSEVLLASAKPAQVRKGEKLRTAVKECVDYERDTLYPLATRNLPIDLDDGVLVNYLRLGTALRTIPAIEKKRSTVQSWTWPTHPLEG